MILVNALKTACDFLLFLSFAAVLAPYRNAWILIGIVTTLAFISSVMFQKTNGDMPFRIICGLFPAIGLLAAKDLSQVLITLPILVFYLTLTIDGRNEIHYEDYKYWFGIPAVPVMVLFAITLSEWPVRPTSTLCAGLYLLFGVLVLRRKRIGSGAGKKLRIVNAVELTTVAAIGMLSGGLVYKSLPFGRKLFEVLLLPIAFLLHLPVYLVGLWGELVTRVQEEEPIPQKEAESGIKSDFAQYQEILEETGTDTGYKWADDIAKWLFIILILTIVIYLLYSFGKVFRGENAGRGTGDNVVEETFDKPKGLLRNRKKRGKKEALLTNNEKIRQIYKEYLFLVRTFGVKVVEQTTSEEVMAESVGLAAHDKGEELRALYIRARYRDADQLSDAEVETAKALLDDIREEIETQA